MELLVSTEWLASELGASDLRIVDATMFSADAGRHAAAEYEAGHIPGAVFMDLAELTDQNSSLPNMLPPPEKFASRMQSLGLGDGSRIIIYDDSHYKTSARAWWMLTLFGAHDVSILDGGIAKWKGEGRALETGKENLRHRHFTVWHDNRDVRTKADLLANLHNREEQIVDARSADRFAEGHIPGSLNIPYVEFFESDGRWKSPEALVKIFEKAGVALDKPVVTTCGSGITAAVNLFAAQLAGASKLALYDGSWSEWGADTDTPKTVI